MDTAVAFVCIAGYVSSLNVPRQEVSGPMFLLKMCASCHHNDDLIMTAMCLISHRLKDITWREGS